MKQYKTSAFTFKQKSQDFIVEEQLPFDLKGKGDAFFVFFEKRNLNTMDVVDHLCKTLKVSRMALGIAGLKDKKAMTRQRISIYKSALQKAGGMRAFLDALAQKVRIITTNRHSHPIGMTTHISNTFYIRLRAIKQLGQEEKEDISDQLRILFTGGFVNLFGEQRFGIDNRNIAIGRAILDQTERIHDRKELLFKLQAYSSQLFNEYAAQRIAGGLQPLDGDIVEVLHKKTGILQDYAVYNAASNTVSVFADKKGGQTFFRHPELHEKAQEIPFDKQTMFVTGPVLGNDLLLARQNSTSAQRERDFFVRNEINAKHGDIYADTKLFGRRRAIWVYPHDFKMKFQGDDVLLRFSLPSGSYASVLIDEMIGLLGAEIDE